MGKVEKIEAQAKGWFSCKKNVYLGIMNTCYFYFYYFYFYICCYFYIGSEYVFYYNVFLPQY